MAEDFRDTIRKINDRGFERQAIEEYMYWEKADEEGNVTRHVGFVCPDHREYVVLRRDKPQIDISVGNAFLSLSDTEKREVAVLKAHTVNVVGGEIGLDTVSPNGLMWNGARFNEELNNYSPHRPEAILSKRYVVTVKDIGLLPAEWLSNYGIEVHEMYKAKSWLDAVNDRFKGIKQLDSVIGAVNNKYGEGYYI